MNQETPKRINLERAIELARLVVARQGKDFVYITKGSNRSCHNVSLVELRALSGTTYASLDETDPRTHTGCIVGSILTEAGETVHHELEYTSSSITRIAEEADNHMLTWDAHVFLATLQREQDAGATWGEALAKGLANVKQ